MVDRRWSTRKCCKLDLQVQPCGHVAINARAIDIGLEGMRFVPEQPLPLNTSLIRLTFGFHDGSGNEHELLAVVVHHTQDTYGLTFLDYDHGLFQRIEEVIGVDSYVSCVC